MGCHILTGQAGIDSPVYEVFFCSTTDWAFGPVMPAGQGEVFMRWLEGKGIEDPRKIDRASYLEALWNEFQGEVWECEDCGAFVTELPEDAEELTCKRCRNAPTVEEKMLEWRERKHNAEAERAKQRVIDDHMRKDG